MTTFLLIGQTRQHTLKSLVEVINNCVPEATVRKFDTGEAPFDAETCRVEDYDLILLDFDLGQQNQDGLKVLQILKKMPLCPPLILLLDNTQDSNIAITALRVGAANYIIKTEINIKNVLLKITESLDATDATMDTQPITLGSEENEEFFDLTDDTLDEEKKTGEVPVIPGYEIQKEIAKGGMSTVLLAKSEEDNSLVVLKVVYLTGHEDHEALKRFIQEYNLISKLVHPHVIRIYERAFASDFAYIAMEYLENGDLSSRIKKGITPGKALEYLRQIALGLETAHKLNIVHRDLKPGNILFKEDDTLVITDFGAAKVLLDDSTDITIGDAIVGTPYYISPEQGTNMQVDNRSDLYSLGVIFHEMLTGRRPYKANSVAQLIRAHVNSPVPQLEGNLKPYQPLMDGLLAKDPDERFQSAGELIIGIEWIGEKSGRS